MTLLEHVSLFSGVGGIDLGMQAAGIPTRAVCEIDKYARSVLARHLPDAHIYTDVKEVTGDGLRALGIVPRRTVLSAGFPCQDLSVAGSRRGMGAGTRSGLYWEVDRILGELHPAWVVLENVPGLLSAACACPGDGTCLDRGLAATCDADTHAVPGGACWGQCIARHGGVMGAVLGSLAQRGYGFAYRVLDARHFGVPQRRRRVVIVGRLGDDGTSPAQVLLEPEGLPGDHLSRITPGPVPAPTPGRGAGACGVLGHHAHTLTAEGHDASEDGTGRGTPIVVVPALAATLTAGTHKPGVSAPGRRQEDDLNLVAYVADTAATLLASTGGERGSRVDAESAAGGHLVAYQKIVRSGARDEQGNLPPEVWAERDVAATLNLHDLGNDTRAVEVVTDLDSPGVVVRRLTPTECERLQGFPDDWTAGQSDSQRYKQLGNAVCVNVFAWVARRITAVEATHLEGLTA